MAMRRIAKLEGKAVQRKQWQLAIGAVALSWLSAGNAWAVAQDVSVSGNSWVAYGIIGALILGIIFFVFATVGATAGRDTSDDGGIGVFGEDDKSD